MFTVFLPAAQIHWPGRYVPLFGAAAYDQANERGDDVPFEEQLRALDNVVRAGKVGACVSSALLPLAIYAALPQDQRRPAGVNLMLNNRCWCAHLFGHASSRISN